MTTDKELVHARGVRVAQEHLTRMGYQVLPSRERRVSFRAALGSRSIPIRVKAISRGQWQFRAPSLMDISTSPDGVQTVLGRKPPPDPGLVCILVKLDEDRFFILTEGELSDVVCTQYEQYLDRQDGVRRDNPYGVHCQARSVDLIPWEDNWDLVKERLAS